MQRPRMCESWCTIPEIPPRQPEFFILINASASHSPTEVMRSLALSAILQPIYRRSRNPVESWDWMDAGAAFGSQFVLGTLGQQQAWRWQRWWRTRAGFCKVTLWTRKICAKGSCITCKLGPPLAAALIPGLSQFTRTKFNQLLFLFTHCDNQCDWKKISPNYATLISIREIFLVCHTQAESGWIRTSNRFHFFVSFKFELHYSV